MRELTYVNGVVTAPEDARVAVDDRGLQFGDGVYEVIRSYGGRLWAPERHFARLRRSLRELWLDDADVGDIAAAALDLHARSGISDALIYIQVTRGAKPRDYSVSPDARPTVVITARQMPALRVERRETGVRVILLPDPRWARVDIKSLNLLGNMMAKKQASEAGAFEAVLQRNGLATEGASTSLFIVANGVVITREEGPHILSGVTRALVIECARELGLCVEERPFTVEELLAADELFLTGTSFGVYGVALVDDHEFAAPGPITRRLDALYHQWVKEERDAPRN